jgi:hypothetical protein
MVYSWREVDGVVERMGTLMRLDLIAAGFYEPR